MMRPVMWLVMRLVMSDEAGDEAGVKYGVSGCAGDELGALMHAKGQT